MLASAVVETVRKDVEAYMGEAEVDLRTARGIEAEVRDRLVAKLGPVIRVVVDQHRSQARNRERALATGK